MDIQGKVVLVTGGAKRIGREISLALAKKGAYVAVHFNRSEEEAISLLKELTTQGRNSGIFQADLSQTSEILRLVDVVSQKIGPIQILINNASIFRKTPFPEITEGEWKDHMDINLKAPFLLSQETARAMLSKKEGIIINMTDARSFHPPKDFLPYYISKAGLTTLTKVLAKELAPHIRVNAVALGPVIPPEGYSGEKTEKTGNKALLQRWGDPKEVANTVCFLIEEAGFATGAVWTIDGGRGLV